MSNEIQKEGGLMPHRDELFEFGLTQKVKEIQERSNIADILDALAVAIRTGEIKDRAEILVALGNIVEKIGWGTYFPKDTTPEQESSDGDD